MKSNAMKAIGPRKSQSSKPCFFKNNIIYINSLSIYGTIILYFGTFVNTLMKKN